MNKDQFAGKWRELKGKVKEKWGRLTDDDVSQINGKYDQLAGHLQRKYGWAKEQADREINAWCSSCEERKGRKEMNRSDEEPVWGGEESSFEEERRPQNEQEWHKRGEPKKPSGNGQNKNKKRKAG
jgi:uncharacterized protein YjbJ (UPF0337 family)